MWEVHIVKKKILMAIVVALLAFSAVPVMAANSPTASAVYNISIGGNTVGKKGSSGIKVSGGSISVSTGTVKIGEQVTLTATPDNGYQFGKWIISGDYTIVSGSLTEGTIVIIPNGDLSINAKFKDKNGTEITEEITTKGSTDPSVTSPKTGATTGNLFVVLLAAGGIAVISRKKLAE
jgi:hypothetical protein